MTRGTSSSRARALDTRHDGKWKPVLDVFAQSCVEKIPRPHVTRFFLYPHESRSVLVVLERFGERVRERIKLFESHDRETMSRSCDSNSFIRSRTRSPKRSSTTRRERDSCGYKKNLVTWGRGIFSTHDCANTSRTGFHFPSCRVSRARARLLEVPRVIGSNSKC